MNIDFLMGISPLVLLMLAIGVFKIPVHKSVGITLVVLVAIAGFYFNTPWQSVGSTLIYGALKGFWPITVAIFGAMFSYNLMLKTGALTVIRNLLSKVTDDERILLILISWCFGGFLEAAAGFSTAVAIPLSILIGLGYNPIRAAIATLVADTVATNFGAVGIPTVVLGDMLGLPTHGLYGISSSYVLQSGLLNLVIPFAMILIYSQSLRALKGIFGITLMVGVMTLLPQAVMAVYVGPELTAFGGALVSMFTLLIMVKLRGNKTPEEYRVKSDTTQTPTYTKGEIARAVSIYTMMFFFILATSPLFPSIRGFFGSVVTAIDFPLADGTPLTVKLDWLVTPGVLIMIASVLGGCFFQGAKVNEVFATIGQTVSQLKRSGFAISAIVAMATLMDVSGIIKVVADPAIAVAGPAYPFLSPVIGGLGTFLTGSVTNANVLFGHLQHTASSALGINDLWLAAANCSGAAAAKMISPQTLSIAVAAPGLAGKDSALLTGALKWFIPYLILISLIVGFGAPLIGTLAQ